MSHESLNSHAFWLAAAYAVAVSNPVEAVQAAVTGLSYEVFRPPPHYALQSPLNSDRSSSDVSAIHYDSVNFSSLYDSDASSLGFSDFTESKVLDDRGSATEEVGTSSGYESICQTEPCTPLKKPRNAFTPPASAQVSREISKSSDGRITRSTSTRNAIQSPYLSSDLDLINVDADREEFHSETSGLQQNVMLISTRPTAGFSTRPRKIVNIRTWDIFSDMDKRQRNWIEKIRFSGFSKRAAIAHVVDTWKALTKTYSILKGRSSEMQQSLKLFVCNAIKLSEYFTLRSCKEISTLLPEFVVCIVGVYLKKPKHFSDLSKPWVQCREVLRVVCETPINVDTLLAILATLGEAKLTDSPKATPRSPQVLSSEVPPQTEKMTRYSSRRKNRHVKSQSRLTSLEAHMSYSPRDFEKDFSNAAFQLIPLFIRTMTSDCVDRDTVFMNYALNEMSDLELRVSQRIQQLQRKETFGLPS